MDKIDLLRRHGLFDARVPRYTSYPPANHFAAGVGPRFQSEWLEAIPDGEAVSIYIHIPFCKRLCWFCACRTQGTKTMRPVDSYVQVLLKEIVAVRAKLPNGVAMARLHLGGGTPTILPCETMTVLLEAVFAAFECAEDFEFSVEIDPTEAAEPLLDVLVRFGLRRASIGVQDFAFPVQQAIGREQSVSQTQHVVDYLRANGTASINFDLLYGLPNQTSQSFRETLDHVLAMSPDRLAMYGYAHVPWIAKRQVMIRDEDLPDNLARYHLAEQAQQVFNDAGFETVGIDHFAAPNDSMAKASRAGKLRRNFQGYTVDSGTTLIGFGASSISRFKQGYVQNAPATSAYQERIRDGGLAGHKGYRMTPQDTLTARMIEDLMCRFALNEASLTADFPDQADLIHATLVSLMQQYEEILFISDEGLTLRPNARPLVRIIASSIDAFAAPGEAHSSAI